MREAGPALRLEEAARLVGGRLVGGPGERVIRGVAPADQAGPDEITLAISARFARWLRERPVGAVLVAPGRALPEQACIEVEDPRAAFDRLVEHFAPAPWLPEPGVHPTAVLGQGVRLGEGVSIGARAVIGHRVVLGRGCVVYPGAVIADDVEVGDESVIRANAVIRERVRIGRRVVVHEGAVIGSDGFGFRTGPDGVHRRRPQAGGVVLEDDVEVGANATVDRASAGNTVIGRGTKIDNLVQVAHNVQLGPGCLVAAQVGIAGSTRVGAAVVMGGQVGVADHVEVGDQAVLYAKTGVIGDVEAGARLLGYPPMPHAQAVKVWAMLRRLPELMRRLEALERAVSPAGQGGAGE